MSSLRTNKLFFTAIIFVLALLVYGRTASYGFVWDDERSHLTRHEAFMKGDLKTIWKKPYDGMYIPLTYTTWHLVKSKALDPNGKLRPGPFHWLNVVTHGINGALVFLLLSLLFKNALASFAGSLVFLLHPLQVESVAWISEFRGLYSSFFSLLSLYVLFKGISKSQLKAARPVLDRHFVTATVLYVLALLCKPSAVVLPLVAGALIWCFFNSHFRSLVKALLLWVLLFIPFALVTSASQSNEVLDFVVPVWQRIFLAGYSLFFYLIKIVFPLNLAGSYGLTPQVMLQGPWAYIITAVVAVILLLLFLQRKKYPYLFTAVLIFVVGVLPVSGLVSFYYQRYSNVADRYMYFPLLGAAMLAAWAWLKMGGLFKYALCAVLVVLAALTFRQQPSWSTEFALWDNSMRHYPDQWHAAYNRGAEYGKMDKLDEAIADYTTALRWKPGEKNTLVNRANAYARLGKVQEALQDYQRALEAAPNDGSIYYNRSLLMYNTGKFGYSLADLQRAEYLGFKVSGEYKKAVMQAYQQQKKPQ